MPAVKFFARLDLEKNPSFRDGNSLKLMYIPIPRNPVRRREGLWRKFAMDKRLLQIVDESIQLELNVSDLYKLFSYTFQEHRDFWWRLVIEEKNHAALLKSVKECFAPIGMVPIGLLFPDLKLLKDTNNKIEMLVAKYKLDPPSRKEAFDTAYQLEQSAGEMHYQTFMERKGVDKVEKIFRELNGDDRDHAQRIHLQMSCYRSDHTINS
jgi:hypothetical protein